MVLPLRRDNLRTRLARIIFEEIVKGTFKPGDRIVGGTLARELGVAQSFLREALHELEYHGLVTKYDNRGTFVTVISREEIDQLYAVRQQLEPFAARLAHPRITPAVHARLSQLLKSIRAAGAKGDLVELAHLDLEFHRPIWHLSGNKWLERALRLVGTPLLAFDYVGLYGVPTYNFEKMYQQHESLLRRSAAIRRRARRESSRRRSRISAHSTSRIWRRSSRPEAEEGSGCDTICPQKNP